MNKTTTGGGPTRAAGRSAFAAAALTMAAASFAPPCFAQADPRPTPPGGRSILMGGTGVALSRDSSAPFLNPATMVRIVDRRLAFSLNVYALSVISLSDWYRPRQPELSGVAAVAGTRTTSKDVGFDDLPSTLCLFLFERREQPTDARAGLDLESGNDYARPPRAPAGTKKLAVCFGTAERRDFGFYDDSRQAAGGGVTLQTLSTLQSFRRYQLGPSFAYALSDDVVVGASLYAQYGVYRGLWSSNVWADDGGGGTAVTSFDHLARGREISATGALGVTYRRDNLTLGLSLALPALSLYGVGSAHRFVRTAQNEPLAWSADGSFHTSQPFRATLGAGYEGAATTYEVDLGLSAPLRRAYRARLSGATVGAGGTSPFASSDAERALPVVNLSAGVEHFFRPSLSVLAGLGTDFSAVPSGALEGEHAVPFFTDRTSRVTASVGLGSYGEGGELLGGVELGYGWGSRLGVDSYRDAPGFAVARQKSYTMLFVLSGSRTMRAIRRALQEVQKTVEGK